jgi:hypothetical protein
MDTSGGEAAADAAFNHPSPLVAANYGYAPRGGGGRGRGYVTRGGGGGGRGGFGGRSFYRAQVQTMLASKTWVRKKDGGADSGDVGAAGGVGGGVGTEGSSQAPGE